MPISPESEAAAQTYLWDQYSRRLTTDTSRCLLSLCQSLLGYKHQLTTVTADQHHTCKHKSPKLTNH